MNARPLIGLTAALLVTTATYAAAGPPVPVALNGLKPYQVIEQIMAQREALNLSDQQFATLDAISLTVRTEQHRFIHQGGKPHNTQHVPMISGQQAFDRALSVLTPEQRMRVVALFPAPEPAQRAPRRYTAPHGKP